MHRLRAWGLSALAAGIGGTAGFAADPPSATPPAEKPWYSRLFGDDEPNPPKSATSPATPARPPMPTAPLAPEAVADALRAEQDAYLRRLEVCTRLRQIGVETNDDSLLAQADTLERQATALYHGRVARLGVKGVRPSAEPAIASKPAERVLDEKLGSGVATSPLRRPTPTQDDRPATASAQNFRRAPQP